MSNNELVAILIISIGSVIAIATICNASYWIFHKFCDTVSGNIPREPDPEEEDEEAL